MAAEQKTLPTRVRWLLYSCAGLGFGTITAVLDAWQHGQPLLTQDRLSMGVIAALFFGLIYGTGIEVLRSHRRIRTPRDDRPAA